MGRFKKKELSDKVKERTCHNLTFSILIGFGGLTNGYLLSLFNNLGQAVINEFKMDETAGNNFLGLVNTLFAAGKMTGSLVGGVLSESLGRKNTQLCAEFIAMLGYASGFANSIGAIQAGRYIVGFICGLNASTVPVMLSECNPKEVRGVVSMLYALFLAMGILSASVLGAFSIETQQGYWKFFIALPAIFSAIRIISIFTCFNYETPQKVLQRGYLKELDPLERGPSGLISKFVSEWEGPEKENVSDNEIDKTYTMRQIEPTITTNEKSYAGINTLVPDVNKKSPSRHLYDQKEEDLDMTDNNLKSRNKGSYTERKQSTPKIMIGSIKQDENDNFQFRTSYEINVRDAVDQVNNDINEVIRADSKQFDQGRASRQFLVEDLSKMVQIDQVHQYFRRKNKEEAMKVIMSFYKSKKHSKEFLDETMNQIMVSESQSDKKQGIFSALCSLFSKEFILPFLVCIFLNIANETTGASFFAVYSNKMLTKIGIDGGKWTMIGGFVQTFADALALLNIEKFGRRKLLMWPMFIQILCLALLGVAIQVEIQWMAIAGYLGWAFFGYLGLYIVYYAYSTEIIPGVGVGVCFFFQYGLRMILVFIFPKLIDGIPLIYIFAGFVVSSILFWFFFWVTALETKGKQKVEIFEEYKELSQRICCCCWRTPEHEEKAVRDLNEALKEE